MDALAKQPRLSVELKQTAKGLWYVGSLRIDAENLVELDALLIQSVSKVKQRIAEFNTEGEIENAKEQEKPLEVPLSPEEEKLFQNLRALRLILAKQEGMPPYVIFHDSTLRRITYERPMDKDGLIRIIGEKKFGKYGDLIFELLEKHKSFPLKDVSS